MFLEGKFDLTLEHSQRLLCNPSSCHSAKLHPNSSVSSCLSWKTSLVLSEVCSGDTSESRVEISTLPLREQKEVWKGKGPVPQGRPCLATQQDSREFPNVAAGALRVCSMWSTSKCFLKDISQHFISSNSKYS